MVYKQKSIKLNVIMNVILTMSSFIFPLITFPYISRILTPVGTGKVSFATSLITYFNMFAQLGIPTYGIRACAKVRDDKEELSKVTQELLLINLVMSLIAYVILFFTLVFMPRLQEDRILYIVISLTLLFNTIGMEWLYKALEQYTYITVRSLILKIVGIFAMFLLVHEQKDYVIYGGITIFAASASNVFNFINIRRYINRKELRELRFCRHFKAIAIFFAMSCATTIYTNLDTIMLGFMTSDADVGYYNAAVKIKIITVNIVTALGVVLLPRASFYIEHNMLDEFKQINRKALNFVFVAAVPMLIYFILFAKQGIYFLSGNEYMGAIMPMKLIMPTLLLIGISYQLGIQILVPLGKEKIVLYSEIAGALANLALNAILIPSFKASGAAFGTLIAELVVLLVQLFALRKEITGLFSEVHYIKILFATLLGIGSSCWVIKLNLGNFVTLIISAFLFFGIYGIILLLMKEPIINEIWKQVINLLYKLVNLWRKHNDCK